MLSSIRNSLKKSSSGSGQQQKMEKEQFVNVLKAAFVADSATMPLHWIYKDEDLQSAAKSLEKPEFNPVASCPFYKTEDHPGHYAVGQPTPYAEEGLVLMDYLSKAKGKFEPNGFANALREWGKTYEGRKNHCTKEFETNAEKLEKEGKPLFPGCGADDAQANVFFKVLPLLPYFGASATNLDEIIEQTVRVHQDKDQAVMYAQAFATLIKSILSGDSVLKALEGLKESGEKEVSEGIEKAMEMSKDLKAKDHTHQAMQESLGDLSANYLFKEGDNEMYKAFLGKTCAFPGAWIVGLTIVLESLDQATTKDESAFVWGVRRNITSGGDNAGRAVLVSSILAAAEISKGNGNFIPKEWQEKTVELTKANNYAL